MRTVLEATFAIAAAAATMFVLARLMRRGALDRRDEWWRSGRAMLVLVPPLCGLAMVFLKTLEYNADHPQSFGPWPWQCGVCRRLDDISLWTLVYGYFLCFFVVGPTRHIRLAGAADNADGATIRRWWRWSAGCAVVLYLIAAWSGSGTFFWWDAAVDHPAINKTLQLAEGVLVLIQIEIAYIFICLMFHHFCARRSQWLPVYMALVFGIVVLLFGANEVSHRVGDVCGASDATGQDGCLGCGRQATYQFGRFWLFVLLVWWPIALMFVVLPFLETRRRHPARLRYLALVFQRNWVIVGAGIGYLASMITLWSFLERLASEPARGAVAQVSMLDSSRGGVQLTRCDCGRAVNRTLTEKRRHAHGEEHESRPAAQRPQG